MKIIEQLVPVAAEVEASGMPILLKIALAALSIMAITAGLAVWAVVRRSKLKRESPNR